MHISVKEAAEMLGKSQRTIRHLAQTGKLPAQRIGSRWLIQREDLLSLQDKPTDAHSSEQIPSQKVQDEVSTSEEVPSHPSNTDSQPSSSGDFAQNRSETTFKSRHKVSFAQALHMPWSHNSSPISVQKVDSFALATSILAEVSAFRAEYLSMPLVDTNAMIWMKSAESAIDQTLQSIADGCHHRRLSYKITRFEQAQSHACTALTHLLHYNMISGSPDFSATCERIEQELIPSLQELMEQTYTQLSIRQHLRHSAELFVEQIIDRAHSIINKNRLGQHILRWQKNLFRSFRQEN